MSLERDAVLRVRLLDVLAGLVALVVTSAVLAASGYFALFSLPIAAGVGVLLVREPGRARVVGSGVLLGLASVLLVVLARFE